MTGSGSLRENVRPAARIAVAQIAGPNPRGACPRVYERLANAVRLHQRLCLSFAGVQDLGDEFAGSCLAPVLLSAAHIGHPACATGLGLAVSAKLHDNFRQLGVLLLDRDRDVVLGASSELIAAVQTMRLGKSGADAVASALGVRELAAAGYLAVLSHWGVEPFVATARWTGDQFPVAA